ncbi:MAG: hypothetical protein J0H02_03195 [Armatimonadetes bacterium]|nr:hypothetical protein [Armatimonadota bacterium]
MSMFQTLRFRLTSWQTVMTVIERLAFEFGPHRDLFQQLPEAWKNLDQKEAIPFAVVERITPRRPPRLVAHGASVFVNDEFLERLKEAPFVAAQVTRDALSANNGVLGLKDIREGQARGDLNLLLLHAQYLDAPTGAMGMASVYEVLARSFFEHHRGYRVKQCLIEAFSGEAVAHHLGSGLFVRANHNSPAATPEAPWLLGVTREESAQNPGARIAPLFLEYPIRLGLRRVHREVLSLALLGMVDEEIANELSLSHSAIKRRWESIYDLVDQNGADLVWGGRMQVSTVRGPERRRHLLNYLREHPEEMRPFVE